VGMASSWELHECVTDSISWYPKYWDGSSSSGWCRQDPECLYVEGTRCTGRASRDPGTRVLPGGGRGVRWAATDQRSLLLRAALEHILGKSIGQVRRQNMAVLEEGGKLSSFEW
jgi:hypothetical protein